MARTVLIVDDIPFVRKTLSAILSAHDFRVVAEASDGGEALEAYRRFKPDIVTMDIVMPHMSGIEATRKIMQNFNDARIVIVSAMEQHHLVMDAINSGARDFIVKPFNADDVVRTLNQILVASGGSAEKSRSLT